MTNEEINKAAEEYAINDSVDAFAESLIKEAFINGAEFSNKHWEEKTRWIPIEEGLPKYTLEDRILAVKYKLIINGIVGSRVHIDAAEYTSDNGWYVEGINTVGIEVICWKEIT